MYTFLAGILAFIALICIYPFVQQSYYLFTIRLKGYEAPPSRYSFPAGIPWFIKTLRSMSNQSLPSDILQASRKVKNRTSRIQVLGRFSFFTVEPENLKTVLATKFEDYGLGERWSQFRPLLGDGIFTLDGKGWSHSRAMLRPQFTREQVSRVAMLEDHTQKLIASLRHYPVGSLNYVDIQEKFFEFTMDTATEFLFGESVDLLSGGNPRINNAVEFGQAFNDSQWMLLRRSGAQSMYTFVTSPSFRRACRVCKSFTDSYVQLALARREKGDATPEKGYVFLDELAKQTTDPSILRDQALNILLAGRDTTASLLSWIFLMLAEHPEVFSRLRQEVLLQFGTSAENISFESLKRCQYLRHVINETLRLYPTVPFNFRVALRDTVLPRGAGADGQSPMFVPKNGVVLYSAYILHRHPDLWGPDADSFKPERWADSSTATSHAWSYLPFNGGPRICLGQQFALTETGYAVVRILQEFKALSLRSDVRGKTPKLAHSLTLNVGGGVPLQFIPA